MAFDRPSWSVEGLLIGDSEIAHQESGANQSFRNARDFSSSMTGGRRSFLVDA
jgi:hypothetical protein